MSRSSGLRGEPGPLTILYEDDALLVVSELVSNSLRHARGLPGDRIGDLVEPPAVPGLEIRRVAHEADLAALLEYHPTPRWRVFGGP